MSGTLPSGALPTEHGTLLGELRTVIQEARHRVAQAANSALKLTYWRVGRRLLAEDLAQGRGEYGRQILATVSQQLEAEFGAGFTYSSLTRMIRFAHLFPDEKSIRVAEYLTELPPPEVLRDRLHRAVEAAREHAALPPSTEGDA